MSQLYAIRVNSSLQQHLWDKSNLARWESTSASRVLSENEVKARDAVKDRVDAYEGSTKVFSWHSGGKGNGAVGGLYAKTQIKRIIGRYPEGVAEAVPVSFGVTQEDSDSNAEDAHFLRCLESAGVDNWDGYDYAREQFQEEGGGNDD